jgi:dTDP-4-dehydrorhamnose reductase
MKPKILVIGSAGLLGSSLLRARITDTDLVGMDRDEIDITNAESIASALDRVQPACVISAAAMTDVEGAENPEGRALADLLNGTAVRLLAEACVARDIGLVQISTDYVFCGTPREGVEESAIPSEPMNAYGASKRLGEEYMIESFGGLDGSAFRRTSPVGYLIRTSWLFGEGSRNFIGKVIAKAQAGETLRIVDDEIGSPTFADDLVDRIVFMLASKVPNGIYHLTGSGSCSRYDFAASVLEAKGMSVPIERIKMQDIVRKAHIEPVSVLKNTKLPPMPDWQDGVKRFAR